VQNIRVSIHDHTSAPVEGELGDVATGSSGR
jgi:hypothetical protein